MIIRSTNSSAEYECIKASGKGSFGVVYKATNTANGDVVAIKRVLQDRRYKNRELQIMKMLNHTNICKLKDNFYEHTKEGVFLNLVLEYVPKNLYEITVSFHKQRKHTPILLVKLYIYQMLRSLAYIHSLGICHRDIKPQNLLINPETHELKLCDFGSAKILIKGEPNVSYICSRYYRAPELIFGATDYTSAIDIWSTGCVMAELLLGTPLFAGESGVDQLVEIIKVLGTPTKDQIKAMNSNYKEFKFPQIKPHSWREVFPANTPESALDLIARMLEYRPQERATALEACAHPFFDELRQPGTVLMTGRALPPLFNFSPEELALAHERNLLEKLIPKHQLSQIPNNFLVSASTGASHSGEEAHVNSHADPMSPGSGVDPHHPSGAQHSSGMPQ